VRVFWSLVIFIICWTTWVLVRASDELRGGQIVQGLTRTYLPPYQHALGWVIDPRSTRLSDELVARYGPELASIPNEPWQKTLRRIGLRLGQFKKTAVLKQPSLLVHQDRKMPDLWIGRFGLKHVMFRDSIGVLTVDELPAYSSVIRLEGVDMPK
tara:strand:- start:1362 stop:1826 length:465 start_codon:yes stop_codon:yes gene_type:complete